MTDSNLNNCFCKDDEKQIVVKCTTRLYYCTCGDGGIEPLIQLKCCSKLVHQSCFNTYLLGKRNELITMSTRLNKNINLHDICLYCQKRIHQDNAIDVPFSNVEKNQKDSFNRYTSIIPTLFKIFIVYAIVISVFDSIFVMVYTRRKIIDYCNVFDDRSTCIDDLKKTHAYAYMFFGYIITNSVGIVMLFTILWSFYSDSDSNTPPPEKLPYQKTVSKFVNKPYGGYYMYNTSIKQYLDIISANQKIITQLKLYALGSCILIVSQIVYTALIIYYNASYIPNHHPKTISEIEDVIKVYAIIFSTCNLIMFMCYLIGAIICLGIGILPFALLITFLYEFCGVEKYLKRRREILNKPQIQLIDVDVEQGNIKKSTV
jgi:hypothetical protein